MSVEADKAAAVRLAIEAAGGVRPFARMVGVANSTINQWIKTGQIPAHRVLQVEAETGIRQERLRPDLYPP